MKTYGICHGDGADTIVREADSLREARAMAREALASGAAEVDVVEMEGRGPVIEQGVLISAAHAPKCTLDTMRADRLRYEILCGADEGGATSLLS